MSSRAICGICGKKYRSARKHLARFHGIRLFTDEDAESFLRLYRIFRKRSLDFPLIPLDELDYDDILLIIRRVSKIIRRPVKAVRLANPFLRELALRYPDRVLKELVEVAKKPRSSMGAMAFVTITYIHRQDIIDILLEIFERKHIHLVEYVAYAFKRYRDRLSELIRKASMGEKKIASQYATFQAIFYVDPALFGELLTEYIATLNDNDFDRQKKDFKDLFDLLVLVPRKYFSHHKALEAFRLLANIKFFGKRILAVSPEKLDLMSKIYMVLLRLDDAWSRIYYGCQMEERIRVPEEVKSSLPKDLKLYSFVQRISNIIEDYPYGKSKLSGISIDEYIEVSNELPNGYIRAYFLYIMADINAKHGLIDMARKLLDTAEKYSHSEYDFMPHVYLLRANVEELLLNFDEAISCLLYTSPSPRDRG